MAEHLHGMSFQVLDIDGVAEPSLGWKDTVRVEPRGTTRIVVRYENPGMWMFDCTIPEHAERGMMGDLHVMEPATDSDQGATIANAMLSSATLPSESVTVSVTT